MRAAVRDRYGPVDVVRIEDVARPDPTEDRILVRVSHASVNRADLDWLTPRPAFSRLFIGSAGRPTGASGSMSQVVEAVGPDATRFRPGDEVFADLYAYGQGAFGEFVVARERAFERIPDGLTPRSP